MDLYRLYRRWTLICLPVFVGMVLAWASGFHIDARLLAAIESHYGTPAKQRVQAWSRLLTETPEKLSEKEKLKRVNRFFNELQFVSDQEFWGQEDYWATPMEFLLRNGGDCEDFTLAKYFTLLELGVPEERLRMTYVKALKLNQAHMVLAYYETANAEPVILDNLIADIRPASRRRDLLPVYSFNGTSLWLAKQRSGGRKVGSSGRLSRWNEYRQRLYELPAVLQGQAQRGTP